MKLSSLIFETKYSNNIIEKYNKSQDNNTKILYFLMYINDFKTMQKWVNISSLGDRFIASPKNASDADRLDCLFAVQKPIFLALQDIEQRRKNGRDTRLIKAAESCNYTMIADILVSSAWSYWLDHGFQLDLKSHLNTAFQLENKEKDLGKREFLKAQIEKIGAVLSFEKSSKKGAFQEILDFDETEEILQNIDFENE